MYVRQRSRRCRDELHVCQDCQVYLCDENWTSSMQKYKRYICKTCWNKRQHKYEQSRRKTNPNLLADRRSVIKARMATWDDNRREKERRRRYNYWLRKNYGITIEQYDAMYAAQGGRCKICATSAPRGRGGFHVDHCHSGNYVRGLLCAECNMMLGLAKDSKEILKNAIFYLTDAEEL